MPGRLASKRLFVLLLFLFATNRNREILAAEIADDLVRTVVAAMRTNEQRLGAVSLRLLSTMMPSPEARKLPDKAVFALNGGGSMELSVAKEQSTTVTDVLLDVGFFEWSMREKDGQLSHMWRLENELWTEFSRIGRRLRVTRRVDDLPSTQPLDPRQLTSPRIGHTVADLLTPDKIAKAERFDDDIVGANSIRIECHDGTLLEFGATAALLPVFRRRVDPGGQVIDELRIKYQPTGRDDALLLKTASTTFSPPRGEAGAMTEFLFRGKIMLSVESFELISHDELVRQQVQQKEFIFADVAKPQ